MRRRRRPVLIAIAGLLALGLALGLGSSDDRHFYMSVASKAAPAPAAPGFAPPDPSGRGDPPARVDLAPERLSPEGLVRLRGHDPRAPRALTLWRVEPGAAVPLARGRSRSDGGLDFPPVPAPRDGATWLVTAEGGDPGAADPASRVQLAPRPPLAPYVVPAGGNGAATRLRITPRESTGAIVLAEPDGRVFGRHLLPPVRAASGRGMELSIEPGAGVRAVLVAHELRDGRRSVWRPVAVAGGGDR